MRPRFCAALVAACLLLSSLPASPQTAQANSAQPQGAERTISGVVVNQATAQPLVDAEVSLSDSHGGPLRMNTRTDAEGRFVFNHLPDGKFAIQAAHRGFIAAGYKEHEGFFTAIVTGADVNTTGLVLTLAPYATLLGTVTDEAGDPVADAQLTLYRQDDLTGRNRIVTFFSTMTDDIGSYEFASAPGNYFVSASATPWYATHRQVPPGVQSAMSRSPLDVAFATTFYGDVTDPDAATPIAVKAGDRVPVNINMHAEPAVHIIIPLRNPPPGQGLPAPQLRVKRFGADEPVSSAVTFTQQEGGGQIAELTVAPGHYELQLQGNNAQKSRSTMIDASGNTQAVEASSLEGLADVDGMVAMAGGGQLPSGMQLGLVDPGGSIAASTFTVVENSGRFRLRGVTPGEYRVSILSMQNAFGITSLSARGASKHGSLVKIGSTSATLAALVDVGRTTVNGSAKQEGKAFAGAMIVLIPTDPDAHGDAYRRDQTDSDGSFSLKQVLPGHYTLLAIDDGWSLEWARPVVMEHYMAHGLSVEVPADRKTVDLKDSVEVQKR